MRSLRYWVCTLSALADDKMVVLRDCVKYGSVPRCCAGTVLNPSFSADSFRLSVICPTTPCAWDAHPECTGNTCTHARSTGIWLSAASTSWSAQMVRAVSFADCASAVQLPQARAGGWDKPAYWLWLQGSWAPWMCHCTHRFEVAPAPALRQALDKTKPAKLKFAKLRSSPIHMSNAVQTATSTVVSCPGWLWCYTCRWEHQGFGIDVQPH